MTAGRACEACGDDHDVWTCPRLAAQDAHEQVPGQMDLFADTLEMP